jgi:hypothetical protein
MANFFDPYIPEWWANAALAVLNEKLVALPLVNRDWGAEFAKGGQVINTRRPGKMTATRKHKATDITAQDLTSANVAIPLDQHIYNSFSVHDLDQQYSMEDLIKTYLQPAGFALAKMADRVILGQAAQFLSAGNVAGVGTQKVYENVVDTRALMDNNLAYEDGPPSGAESEHRGEAAQGCGSDSAILGRDHSGSPERDCRESGRAGPV